MTGCDIQERSDDQELAECLNRRPVADPYRGWSRAKFVHDTLAGRWDFTLLLSERIDDCVRKGLCSMCGKSLQYWMAFIRVRCRRKWGL